MAPVLIEHVKVSDLPESWRTLLTVGRDARVTVRIEEESASTQDCGCAFGMWSDREELADVGGYVRRLRASRWARGDQDRAVLVDTDIVIGYLRGHGAAAQILSSLPELMCGNGRGVCGGRTIRRGAETVAKTRYTCPSALDPPKGLVLCIGDLSLLEQQRRRRMAKPSFTMMWQSFPDHTKYPSLRELHTFIGGTLAKNIDVPGFGGTDGNTCAVRMSRALNYGNLQISAKLVKSLKINTMTGGDGKLYIFRVSELRTYLENALGVTPTKVTKNFGNAFTKKQGIVAFTVTGWSNASGHLALWNRGAFREPEHDDYRNLKDDPGTKKVEPYTTAMTLWEI